MLKEKYNGYGITVEGFVDGHLNYWKLGRWEFSFEELNKKNLLKVKNVILDMLDKQMFEGTAMGLLEEDNMYIDCNTIGTSQFSNADNKKPTKKEIEEWENNEPVLYVQNILIYVYINGEQVKTEDLKIIMSL